MYYAVGFERREEIVCLMPTLPLLIGLVEAGATAKPPPEIGWG